MFGHGCNLRTASTALSFLNPLVKSSTFFFVRKNADSTCGQVVWDLGVDEELVAEEGDPRG